MKALTGDERKTNLGKNRAPTNVLCLSSQQRVHPGLNLFSGLEVLLILGHVPQGVA